jgi:threonine/homoserine/homoserine lactone efflux protein
MPFSAFINYILLGNMELSLFISLATSYLMGIMSPGPSLLLVVTNTLLGGRKEGFITAFGIVFAIALQVILALFFLKLVSQNIVLFVSLKTLCAGFLVYLGFGFLKGKADLEIKKDKKMLVKNFLKAFFLEMLNPIALSFFITIFAFHTKDIEDIRIKILCVLMLFTLGLIWFFSASLLVSNERMRAKFFALIKVIKKIAGVMFIGYGSVELYEVVIDFIHPLIF